MQKNFRLKNFSCFARKVFRYCTTTIFILNEENCIMIEGEGKEGFFKKLVLDVTGVVKERIIGKYFSEMKGCYGKMLILNWKALIPQKTIL